jgi:Taurine catabolism dioxygenase TauD, TfdA family
MAARKFACHRKRAMDLAIKKLHPLFAAEVRGADLSRDVDPATRDAIEQAMDAYAVCVLPQQNIDDERQVAFSRLYGPLENASAVVHQRKAPPVRCRQLNEGSLFFRNSSAENPSPSRIIAFNAQGRAIANKLHRPPRKIMVPSPKPVVRGHPPPDSPVSCRTLRPQPYSAAPATTIAAIVIA